MACLRFKPRFPSILAGLLLCLGPVTANAADVWTRIESSNFEFIGNAPETDIRQVASRLERFRAAFRSVFPQFPGNSGKRTRVVVFKDSESFRTFKPSVPMARLTNSSAPCISPGKLSIMSRSPLKGTQRENMERSSTNTFTSC